MMGVFSVFTIFARVFCGTSVFMGELEFPFSHAHGFKIVRLVEEVVGFLGRLFCRASKNGEDVFTVDCVFRERGIDKFGDGRKEVNGHDGGINGLVGFYLSWVAENCWDAKAAFPRGAFCSTKLASASAVVSVNLPRSVVASE